MTWSRGRAEVEKLITDGELERVEANAAFAERLVHDAVAHVKLATVGVSDDPAGALQLAYDAARESAAALLAQQGLRATTRGGHIAVMDAVKAQFNDKGGIEVFGRLHALRRRRNRTEYPDPASPGVNAEDAQQAIDTATGVLDAARQLIASGRVDRFE